MMEGWPHRDSHREAKARQKMAYDLIRRIKLNLKKLQINDTVFFLQDIGLAEGPCWLKCGLGDTV